MGLYNAMEEVHYCVNKQVFTLNPVNKSHYINFEKCFYHMHENSLRLKLDETSQS
jgi:hypothetical protein